LVSSVDVTDVHGDFVADGTFGGVIAWSRDEQALLYTAEPTDASFEGKPVYEKYRFESDWGERMPQRTRTCLVLVRLSGDKPSASVIPGLPSTIGQVRQ
jgi:hypothetical protein